MKISTVLYSLMVMAMISSCVSQKKFDELLTEKVKRDAEYADLEERLSAADLQILRLEEEADNMEADNQDMATSIAKLNQELKTLQSEHKQLEIYYNNLLTKSGNLNKDLAEQQQRLLSLQETLDAQESANQALATNLAEREKKVDELERILDDKEKAIQGLREKISKALLAFDDSDLTVEVKNGKVYVSLAEKLLFGSGSTVVDPKGQQALRQLATALKGAEDIDIMVEGHTDNVPIATKSIKDNWDLSVLRATAIVRILTSEGLNPNMISASGKGENNPVAPNTDAEGRSLNRRTEIIITPDLDELFAIIEDRGE